MTQAHRHSSGKHSAVPSLVIVWFCLGVIALLGISIIYTNAPDFDRIVGELADGLKPGNDIRRKVRQHLSDNAQFKDWDEIAWFGPQSSGGSVQVYDYMQDGAEREDPNTWTEQPADRVVWLKLRAGTIFGGTGIYRLAFVAHGETITMHSAEDVWLLQDTQESFDDRMASLE